MRILIHTPGHRTNLPLPTVLALNPATASLIARVLRDEVGLPVSAEQVRSLFAIIRAEKTHRPDWVPLEIQTKDVHISIRA